MKKILFINDFFVVCGGAEKVMLDIIKNMSHTDTEISVFTFFKDDNFGKVYDNSINYFYATDSNEKNDEKLCEIIEKNKDLITEKINKENYDIVVAMKEGYCTKFVSELNCKYKIGWIHVNYRDNYWTDKVYSAKEELKVMKKFDKIVCVSEDAKNTVIETIGNPNNLCVRYNPVDNNKIIEMAKEDVDFETSSDMINFLSVGRLDVQKGYDRLIEVANKLLDEGYRFKLYIVGDTDNENYKKYLMDKVRYNDNIIFLGKKLNPYPYIKRADCFISSSIWESFGVAIQEAVILHTPVIMTKCLGAIEIFDDNKAGIVVENSEDGIYSGMLSILKKTEMLEKYREYLALDNYIKVEERINNILDLF